MLPFLTSLHLCILCHHLEPLPLLLRLLYLLPLQRTLLLELQLLIRQLLNILLLLLRKLSDVRHL